MLKDFLENKKCFKLVCGAGNEDVVEVEKLVTLYSKAGCMFFDVCAKPEIVDAAKRGIKNSGITKDRYICVSVGISGDPHITKAVIDREKCVNCNSCYMVCPHMAISENIEIIKERCLGCGQCLGACSQGAINMVSQIQDYREVLPPIIEKGIDCIEFHAISEDENEVNEKWEQLNSIYDGMLCISIDRSILGDIKLKERVKKLVLSRKPYSTIIQADGVAMSGNNDEYGTTLQAVATAQMFQNMSLPAYIMISGGTNTVTTKLAKMCGVSPNCVAVGSFARKIVKNYLLKDDLLENDLLMQEASIIAKNLIDNVLENMGD